REAARRVRDSPREGRLVGGGDGSEKPRRRRDELIRVRDRLGLEVRERVGERGRREGLARGPRDEPRGVRLLARPHLRERLVEDRVDVEVLVGRLREDERPPE